MSDVPENPNTSVPDGPEPVVPQPAGPSKSGKSREEVYLELAKLSQQSFESRRTYEFKAAFGLWTGIGAITYFAIEHPGVISGGGLGVLLGAYLVMAFVWIFGWQPFIHYAHRRDKKWKHYYMHRAENRAEIYPAKKANRSERDPWLGQRKEDRRGWCAQFCKRSKTLCTEPSAWTQCAITVLLLTTSFLIIHGSSSLPPVTEKKDRICVSGDNVPKVLDRLPK